jgi:hypothetical protein
MVILLSISVKEENTIFNDYFMLWYYDINKINIIIGKINHSISRNNVLIKVKILLEI